EGRRVTATHSELVAFACEVAGWTGARGEIPVIGEFARGRGKSRFVHECRRLHARLTASVRETAAVSRAQTCPGGPQETARTRVCQEGLKFHFWLSPPQQE